MSGLSRILSATPFGLLILGIFPGLEMLIMLAVGSTMKVKDWGLMNGFYICLLVASFITGFVCLMWYSVFKDEQKNDDALGLVIGWLLTRGLWFILIVLGEMP